MVIKLTCLAEYLFHISNLWTDNYLNYLYESNFYIITVLLNTKVELLMEEWAIKSMSVWNEKIRECFFVYVQKHLLKVCLCVLSIPQVANFFHFFPYQNHWVPLIFKAKAVKLSSRDTETGQWKNIQWLKNIVLTRVVQIKKN